MLKNLKKDARVSYSQCGEDLIVDFLMRAMHVNTPTYLDLGTHHPYRINNTYLFYEKGSSGVCVEPDPTLFSYIRKKRKRDICLNVGVGLGDEEKAKFYILSSGTLSTFSRDEAERYQTYQNQKIEKVLDIPLVNVNRIIEENFDRSPNFVSVDIEGLDLDVMKTFDFKLSQPEVFCIETLTYTEDKTEKKIVELIDLMKSQNYLVYADTYINTIFVNQKSWATR